MLFLRKRDNLKKRLKELSFNMGVITAMLGTLDLEYLLYVILSGVTSGDGLGFNRALLFLKDANRDHVSFFWGVGPENEVEADRIWRAIKAENIEFKDLLPRYETFKKDEASLRLTKRLQNLSFDLADFTAKKIHPPPLQTIISDCILKRATLTSNKPNTCYYTIIDPNAKNESTMHFGFYAAIPLIVNNTVIGAIFADNSFNQAPVDDDLVERLSSMGGLAALAIDRARMHEHAVSMAEIDGLTGLFNRSYYDAAIERAIEQCKLHNTTLSLLVVDIDYFKQVNDKHGHLSGDEVLKELAAFLMQQTRTSDVVARYGGEEFVVLLPSANLELANKIATRICKKISQKQVTKHKIPITVSIGAAQLAAESAADLFARADIALYHAKNKGRNNVQLATGGDVPSHP